MNYISVSEIARLWGVTDRSVRKYCADGRIEGAFLTGKTWNIPADAVKPSRKRRAACNRKTLSERMREEMHSKLSGGIYHKVQIDLTYNSNHMEGSCLTHEQTRYIFETNTIGITDAGVNVDDIVETANHFKCVDLIIEGVQNTITENSIKQLHRVLKEGTSDSRKPWFAVGKYKKLPNEVGGEATTPPEQVRAEIKALLAWYQALSTVTLEDIVEFHVRFERIHPFQDSNGRVGRLLMFKECLKHNITPFIIDEEHKLFYYRGLALWHEERGYLLETCRSAQDSFQKILEYYRIFD